MFRFVIPEAPHPMEMLTGPYPFGLHWGGMPQFVQRIIFGYDAQTLFGAKQILNLSDEQSVMLQSNLPAYTQATIPYEIIDLQDSIDLVILLIRTTISILNLSTGVRGVGGPIDVATITRKGGFDFVQKKSLTGEGGHYAI